MVIIPNLDCKYLNWRDPKVTGLIVGTVNLLFVALCFSKLSLASIACYMFLFYIIAGIILSTFMEKPKKEYNILI
jgi:hypothetical protein